MHALNKVFERIFVVSLEDCVDRRQFICEQFKEVDIKFEFVDAVDGRNKEFDPSQWDKDASVRNRFMPTPRQLRGAEVGCALSHNKVYQKIIDERINTALILEDDVSYVLGSDLYLSESIEGLDWDLLYLGVKNNRSPESLLFKLKRWLLYPLMRFVFIKRRSSLFRSSELKKVSPRFLNDKMLMAGCHHGTHAYAVSRKGAEIVLLYNSPVRLPSDLALNELIVKGEMNSLLFKNEVFVPRVEAGSTIGNPV